MSKPKEKYNRQQTVHLLPIPYDIAEEINSFCFYDKITAKTRRLKKTICKKFKNACGSRANPSNYWIKEDPTDFDNCEHWALCLTDKYLVNDPDYDFNDPLVIAMYEEKHFKAINCHLCGNYIISNSTGYSFYELYQAVEIGVQEWIDEVRERMPKKLRCECALLLEDELMVALEE
jgi:hypothetical protein